MVGLFRANGNSISRGRRRQRTITDRLFLRCAEQFWMQVLSPLLPRLLFLVWNAMRVGECILSNAGYLPGHFAFRFASADLEAVACHLLDDVQVRPRRTNRSQLIA